MNKFEALKQFQGWPAEWQRLCAEYWIETGEVDPTQVLTFGDKLESAKKLFMAQESVQAKISARLEQNQPKAAAKVAAKASAGYTHSGYPVQLWEKDAIDGMIHQQLNDTAIAKAMELGWPFRRTKRAWEQLAYGRRKLASGKGGCR